MSAPAPAPAKRVYRKRSASATSASAPAKRVYRKRASVSNVAESPLPVQIVTNPAPRSKGFYPKNDILSKNPSYKKKYDAVDPEMQSLINQVLDPDSVSEAVRWPMSYGLSSVYKSINTVDAQFDVNGQSCVIVYPRLVNSIFATAGGSYTQTLTVSGTPAGNYLKQSNFTLDETHPVAPITDIWYFNDDHACIPRPQGQFGVNRYLYPFSWNSSDTTPVINFQFSNVSSGDAGSMNFTTRWYDASGAQTHTVTTSVPANGLVSQTLNPVPATNVNAYMSFDVTFVSGGGYFGTVTAQLREIGPNPTFAVTLPDVANHCLVYDLNGAQVISQSAEMYFVSAQSLLCTFTGSDLNNGGLIATARVPADTVLGSKSDQVPASITANPFYNWVASLSNNRYDGAIKDGSYSFYLGQDESDYFYKPVEDSFTQDTPYLISCFNSTDSTQANLLRIKVITHVQFTSNNNIYSAQISPLMRDSRMLQFLLSIVPSSYCNPLHKAEIAQYLKDAGKRLARELKKPELWASAGKLAARILFKSIPVVGNAIR